MVIWVLRGADQEPGLAASAGRLMRSPIAEGGVVLAAGEGVVGEFVEEGEEAGFCAEGVPACVGGGGEEDDFAFADGFGDDGGVSGRAVGFCVAEDGFNGAVLRDAELKIFIGLDAEESVIGTGVGDFAELFEDGVREAFGGEGEALGEFGGGF